MLTRLSGAALGALLAVSGAATAQNYPVRPLTMIIPFAAVVLEALAAGELQVAGQARADRAKAGRRSMR